MTDNPYAPPSAPVQDCATLVPKLEVCPREVRLAVGLAAFSYVTGFVLAALHMGYYERVQSTTSFGVTQILSIAFIVWLYSNIYVGRNWARIVLLVFTVVGLVGILGTTFIEVARNAMAGLPLWLKVSMALKYLINAVVLWLLFISPGRHWFSQQGAARGA